MNFKIYRNPIILKEEEEYNKSIGCGFYNSYEEIPKKFKYPYKYCTLILKSKEIIFKEKFSLIRNRIKSKFIKKKVKNIYDFIKISDINKLILDFVGKTEIRNCTYCSYKIIFDSKNENNFLINKNYICNCCIKKLKYKNCDICKCVESYENIVICSCCELKYCNECIYNNFDYGDYNFNICKECLEIHSI